MCPGFSFFSLLVIYVLSKYRGYVLNHESIVLGFENLQGKALNKN